MTSDQSGSYRLAVWRDSIHLAVEHAEKDYLELLAEGGIVAAGLVAALAALALTRGLRGAASHADRLTRGLATGAAAGLVAIAVHCAFDFNLRIPSNTLLCIALVAFVLAVPANRSARTPRLLVPFLLLVTLAVALLTPWAAPRVDPGPMLRAAHSGDASLRRTGLEANLISHLQRRPADAAAWLALAWLRVPTSRDEASALAEWAVRLDPANSAVRARTLAEPYEREHRDQ